MMGRITGKSYGRNATLKGLGRTRMFAGKLFECISQGEKESLQVRGRKLVKRGIYRNYRVTVGTAKRNSSWEQDELWVR